MNQEKCFVPKCGFVITEKLQESGPEWRSFTQDEHGDRARAGAQHHLQCMTWVLLPSLIL